MRERLAALEARLRNLQDGYGPCAMKGILGEMADDVKDMAADLEGPNALEQRIEALEASHADLNNTVELMANSVRYATDKAITEAICKLVEWQKADLEMQMVHGRPEDFDRRITRTENDAIIQAGRLEAIEARLQALESKAQDPRGVPDPAFMARMMGALPKLHCLSCGKEMSGRVWCKEWQEDKLYCSEECLEGKQPETIRGLITDLKRRENEMTNDPNHCYHPYEIGQQLRAEGAALAEVEKLIQARISELEALKEEYQDDMTKMVQEKRIIELKKLLG